MHSGSWLKSITDGVVVLNREGQIVGCNPSAERIFQWKEDELRDKPLEILLTSPCKEDLQKFLNTKPPTDLAKPQNSDLASFKCLSKGRRKDGSLFPLEISLGLFKQEKESSRLSSSASRDRRKAEGTKAASDGDEEDTERERRQKTKRKVAGLRATDKTKEGVKRKQSPHFVAIIRDLSSLRRSKEVATSANKGHRYETEFEEVELLGCGGFGSVYKCKNRLDDQFYAIKKIYLQPVKDEGEGCLSEATVRQLNEVKLLASITNHPNIVRYYTSWVEYLPKEKGQEVCLYCSSRIPLSDFPSHISECKESKDENQNKGKQEQKNKPKSSSSEWLYDSDASNSKLSQEKHSVRITDFEVLKRLNGGAYGRVFLVRKKDTKELYAMKVIRKKDAINKNFLSRVIKERDLLYKAGLDSNPFVVPLFYTFQSEDNLYLVMGYMAGGDVATLLHEIGYFDHSFVKEYAVELILAIESLHSKSVVHRDIKPDNILIDRNGHLKLTDFGLSCEALHGGTCESFVDSRAVSKITQSKLRHSVVGTADYLAPEIIEQAGHSYAVDWWALGVTLYELLTGIPPFSAKTAEEIFDNISNRRLYWPSEELPLSSEVIDLIEQLLTTDPTKRLGCGGAQAIKSHPFFADINWEQKLMDVNAGSNQKGLFIPKLQNSVDTCYFKDRIKNDKSFDQTEAELLSTPVNNKSGKTELSNCDSKRRKNATRLLGFSFVNTKALQATGAMKDLPTDKKAKKDKARKESLRMADGKKLLFPNSLFSSWIRSANSALASSHSGALKSKTSVSDISDSIFESKNRDISSCRTARISRSPCYGDCSNSSGGDTTSKKSSLISSSPSSYSSDCYEDEEEEKIAVLYIQMQLYQSQTLASWIDDKQRDIDTQTNLELFSQIVKGLSKIHAHGIIHRDLKPANIFIDEDQIVKIGDFGLATIQKSNIREETAAKMNKLGEGAKGVKQLCKARHMTRSLLTGGIGTALYAAPEQLYQKRNKYDEKADIYALGVILVEMYCPPFKTQMERICTLSKLRSNWLPPHITEAYPDEASLIKLLLNVDPNERPSTQELIQHPLMQDFFVVTPAFRPRSASDSGLVTAPCRSCDIQRNLVEHLSAEIRDKDKLLLAMGEELKVLKLRIATLEQQQVTAKPKKPKRRATTTTTARQKLTMPSRPPPPPAAAATASTLACPSNPKGLPEEG